MVTGSACYNTCAGSSCDTLASSGYLCSQLEAGFDCDCGGCDCGASVEYVTVVFINSEIVGNSNTGNGYDGGAGLLYYIYYVQNLTCTIRCDQC